VSCESCELCESCVGELSSSLCRVSRVSHVSGVWVSSVLLDTSLCHLRTSVMLFVLL